MSIKDYKDLDVWKKGIEIVDFIYDLTSTFPKNELYGLGVQLQKSSISIPSNIAEGFNRQYTKEYIQFIYIALGSCAEVDTQIIIARRRRYLSEKMYQTINELLNHEIRMLRNLIKSLTK